MATFVVYIGTIDSRGATVVGSKIVYLRGLLTLQSEAIINHTQGGGGVEVLLFGGAKAR